MNHVREKKAAAEVTFIEEQGAMKTLSPWEKGSSSPPPELKPRSLLAGSGASRPPSLRGEEPKRKKQSPWGMGKGQRSQSVK